MDPSSCLGRTWGVMCRGLAVPSELAEPGVLGDQSGLPQVAGRDAAWQRKIQKRMAPNGAVARSHQY